MRRRSCIKRKGGKLKRGSKAYKWDKIKKQLKEEFLDSGITECEGKLEGCLKNFGICFNHRMKRRFIKNDDELKVVALLCASCSQQTEYIGREGLYKLITEIIERR